MPTSFYFLKQRKFQRFVCFLLAFFFLTPTFAQKKADHLKSSFTATLMNIEATAKQTFRYNTLLHNAGKQPLVYDLGGLVPEGWMITFQTQGSEVASVRVDSGQSVNISIQINASPGVSPGKYTIPVKAFSPADTLTLQLQAVVKGTYGVVLTTPTGLLSDDVTEGRSKVIQLTINNTGTLPLQGLNLSSGAPAKWTVTFDPSKVDKLNPGKSMDVKATVNVPDKTIAGDYVTTFSVKNNYANADSTFRLTVKTSLLSGWIGVLIILIALGIVYYLIRKYGRR